MLPWDFFMHKALRLLLIGIQYTVYVFTRYIYIFSCDYVYVFLHVFKSCHAEMSFETYIPYARGIE